LEHAVRPVANKKLSEEHKRRRAKDVHILNTVIAVVEVKFWKKY
jgi:hypothetical protein